MTLLKPFDPTKVALVSLTAVLLSTVQENEKSVALVTIHGTPSSVAETFPLKP
jgi:hypothetical protein